MALAGSFTGSRKRNSCRPSTTSSFEVLRLCRTYVDADGNVEVFLISSATSTAREKIHHRHVSLDPDSSYLSSSDDDTNSAAALLNETEAREAISMEYSDSEDTTEENNTSSIIPKSLLSLSSPSHPSSDFHPDAKATANAMPQSPDNDGNDPSEKHDASSDEAAASQDTETAAPVANSDDTDNNILQQQHLAPLEPTPREIEIDPKKLDAQAFLRTLLLLAFWVGQLKAATYMHNLALGAGER